jgi:signal peptidase II
MIAPMAPKTRWFALTAGIAFILDKLTKQWILGRLAYGEVEPVVPGWLDWTYVENPGGAFSLFADADPTLRTVFFLGMGGVALILLGVFFTQLDRDAWPAAGALGAVLGGALGNLTDRLTHGAVVDWIDVHITATYIWPTFNVADACIVVGVLLLLGETFLERPEDEPGDSARAEPMV